MVETIRPKELETAEKAFHHAQNLRDSGNPEAALFYYDKAMQLAKSDKERIIYLQQKGVSLKEMGDFEGALEVFGDAQNWLNSLGLEERERRAIQGNILRDAGITQLAKGEAQKAHDTLNLSEIALYGTDEDPGGVALSISAKAKVLARLKKYDEAETAWSRGQNKAWAALEQSQGKIWWPISTVLTDYAKFLFSRKNHDAAQDFAKYAIKVTREGIKKDRELGKKTRQDKRLALLYLILAQSERMKRERQVRLVESAQEMAGEYLANLDEKIREQIVSWVKNPD